MARQTIVQSAGCHGFWSVVALVCLQMGFTASAQLRLPQAAKMFTTSASDYFRVELSWAKLLLVALLLLAPVPARRRERAYACFAITLASALIAHFGTERWPRKCGAGRNGVLWALSDFFWRRLQATPASARPCPPAVVGLGAQGGSNRRRPGDGEPFELGDPA